LHLLATRPAALNHFHNAAVVILILLFFTVEILLFIVTLDPIARASACLIFFLLITLWVLGQPSAGWGQQDPNQWGGGGGYYGGYGQGYDQYGYPIQASQDAGAYGYGAYAGYGNYSHQVIHMLGLWTPVF
jgi:hypothetical protein